MTLFLYISRRFLITFAIVLTLLSLLYALLDMLEVSQRFDGAGLAMSQILTLTGLRAVEGVYQFLPFVILLSTIALFLALARSSELVVIRAAGRSALRLLWAPVAMSFLIGILAVTTLNPLVAATKAQYDTLAGSYQGTVTSVLSVSRDGLWLRQGDGDGETVIRAAGANADGTVLSNVSFYGFEPGGEPVYRIQAASAQLAPGAWQITDFRRWDLTDPDTFDPEPLTGGTMALASSLTADQIRDGFGTPSSISIWSLPGFIAALEQAGFSARRHAVWLQSELARPIFFVATMLIGAALTMRHGRFGRTGIMAMASLLFGFGFFFVRNFAQILGENGQLPAALAAWAVPVAAILLCLAMILHLEDG